MNGSQASSAAATLPEEDYYPASDGQPMAETEIHVLLIIDTFARLRHFFRRRHDVYVAGNMFLYYQKGNPRKRRAPDIMVIRGVDGRVKRRSFKTWEEKAVPRTIVEFTSQETAAEDLGAKKHVYQTLKVREYFLFDPLQEYLPHQLLGFRYVRSVYQPMIPAADGSLVSEELGLRLCPEGDYLGLYDVKTGDKLLPMEDALQLLDDTQKELQKQSRQLAELKDELKRLRQGRRKKP